MSPITSVYLPIVQKEMNAEFIAHIFEKNDIAKVSRIAVEFNRKTKKHSAYVGIEFWHDTECAYNFIRRLNNPNKEARIVYRGDDWLVAKINKSPQKLLSSSSNKKRVLTIFNESRISLELTQAIKIALFGEPIEPNFLPFDQETLDEVQDINDFDSYCREIDFEREQWSSEQ